MMPQVPLPSGDVWVQFSVVSVIVLCIALLGTAIFAFTRWIWNQYKIEREKDLAWRENQNNLREAAQDARDKLWREMITAQYTQYNLYDRERQATLLKLVDGMGGLAEQLKVHHEQAKEIGRVVNRVDENTRPSPGQPGYERRKQE
jgi:muconolactone delta-isomerase